jgi:two-component system chemotaxis sensor kinase CheA
MDFNQKRFIEDALDLLNELDEGLLQLEATPHAIAAQEQVFRTMHTLKGGAGMFGFESLGTLAQQFETTYNWVRQRNLPVPDGLIRITRHAFNEVRRVLKEEDVADINNNDTFREHIRVAGEFRKAIESTGDLADLSGTKVTSDELATFFLRVSPSITLTEDGNHPLIFMVQDIALLGNSRVLLHKHPSGAVAHWEVILATTIPEVELENHFMFTENACTVYHTRLVSGDLLEDVGFHKYLDTRQEESVELAALQPIIDRYQRTGAGSKTL